jgi:hypothetical protein
MKHILKILAIQSMRVHAIAIAASLMIIFLAKATSSETSAYLSVCLPYFAGIYGLTILSLNISWIKNAPIKKSEILFTNFILFWANLFFAILVGGGLNRIVNYLFYSEEIAKETSKKGDPEVFAPLIFAMTGLIFLISLAILIIGNPSQLKFAKFQPRNKHHVFLFSAASIVAGIFIIAVTQGVINYFFLLISFFICIPASAMAITTQTLGFSRPNKRRWIFASLSLGILCSAILTVVSFKMLKAPNIEDRLFSASLLGWMSGKSEIERAIEVLKSDAGEWTLRDALQDYKKVKLGRDAERTTRLLNSRDGDFSFRELVENKSSFEKINRLLREFDPRHLSNGDLIELQKKLGDTSIKGSFESDPRIWAYIKMENETWQNLLLSNSKHQVDIALVNLLFQPSRERIHYLSKHLKDLPESSIEAMTKTLSILTAKKFGIFETAKVVTQQESIIWKMQDCSEFSVRNLKSNPYDNTRFCIRNAALNESYDRLLEADTVPFDEKDLEKSKVYRLKNAFYKPLDFKKPTSSKSNQP